jgi:hypothetical protein
MFSASVMNQYLSILVSKGTYMRSLLALLLAFAALSAQAADRFVRQGASGNGSGSDWANAYTDLPANLVRGDTYYIADGTYSGRTFKDEASGTTPITIKKCTGASHGTETGYNASYCDGKASVSGSWAFTRPYYVIDGATRNESNWKDHASYGFSVPGFRASRLDGGHVGGNCSADNITIRNVHVGNTATSYQSATGEGFYIAGFGGGSVACKNWSISRVLAQNTRVAIQCAGCTGLLVESSYFYVGWGKEAIRGQLDARNMTVRWSVFEDSCMTLPGTTDRCTAEIAAWGENPVGNYDNMQVYGNVFYKTNTYQSQGIDTYNSNAVILFGGDGSSVVGPPANNARIYNNTIAGHRGDQAIVKLLGSGTGNECRNNLWANVTGGTGVTGSCAGANNLVLNDTPFVSYANGDFRLSRAVGAGTSLSAPYNVDRLGNSRGADGLFDIGAYEYNGGGAPVALSAPLNLTVR